MHISTRKKSNVIKISFVAIMKMQFLKHVCTLGGATGRFVNVMASYGNVNYRLYYLVRFVGSLLIHVYHL